MKVKYDNEAMCSVALQPAPYIQPLWARVSEIGHLKQRRNWVLPYRWRVRLDNLQCRGGTLSFRLLYPDRYGGGSRVLLQQFRDLF